MQCYHCEETLLNNDCSSTKFIVNCTANIQDACQKEVMVGAHGGFCIYSLHSDHNKPNPPPMNT